MDWIQTYTGRRFFPLEPKAADVDIRDIAHALSLKTRFGGHSRVFYSVAEHSVGVSQTVEPQHALWGLLHDAAEAYLADVPRPVKRKWPEFNAMEQRVLQAIQEHFHLSPEVPPAVWHADDLLLAEEARDLMAGGAAGWALPAPPSRPPIVPITWEAAESAFLDRYRELTQANDRADTTTMQTSNPVSETANRMPGCGNPDSCTER